MPLPREVESAGRALARRVGIDEADAISFTAQAWAEHPDCWRTVAHRRCVDQRRHESGQGPTEHRPLVVLDEPTLDAGARVGELIACDEPGFAEVEARCDLAALIGELPDDELAALARRHWLGLPAGKKNSEQAVAEARAMRHARAQTVRMPAGCPVSAREVEVLAALADGLTVSGAAEQLFISAHTIKTHLARITRRVGARNTTHAVALALRAGWIT